MPPICRNWLYYKNFTDEDIKELEGTAELLTLRLMETLNILRIGQQSSQGTQQVWTISFIDIKAIGIDMM